MKFFFRINSIIIQIKNKFIRKPNIPSVIILKGRNIILKKGFIKEFIIPIRNPAIKIFIVSPSKLTPGIYLKARNNATITTMV